jgi:hypothetical protein
MAQVYAAIGNDAKAKEVMQAVWDSSDQYVTFYNSLQGPQFKNAESNIHLHMFYIMQRLINIAAMIDEELAVKYEDRLEEHAQVFTKKGGRLPQF